MWDVMKDKLLPALLALGCTFPLHEALSGHHLPELIQQEHRQLREELSSNKKQEQSLVILNLDNDISAQNSTFSADAKLTDDDEQPTHRCHRCNRHRKEVNATYCDAVLQQATHASLAAHACLLHSKQYVRASAYFVM